MSIELPDNGHQMPSILVAHPWMANGGSEATAMWTLQALQDSARLVFTTASSMDLDAMNAAYGTSVSPDRVSFVTAPSLPGVSSGHQMVYWQRAHFERHCRKLAPRFDVCISAYNPIHFGKPGIQLIGDFSFSEKSRLMLYPNAEDRFCHRQSLLRRAYLIVGNLLHGWRQPPYAERGDCAVANSFWTAERLEQLFRINTPPVLYPPSLLPDPPVDEMDQRRDPLGFVCLGRISPEKEIERIIGILDQVRQAGRPVTLELVGAFGNDAYSRRIREMVEKRKFWIRTPGYLSPKEKTELFSRRTFAIHGCRVEAFGIAVAEMTAAGLIPIVPDAGGSGEIAHFRELRYASGAEGVRRILRLLDEPELIDSYRQKLIRHTAQFRPEAFVDGLRSIVAEFLGRSIHPEAAALPVPPRHVAEDHAASH
ncbi:MAG: glycosyltransferase [Verrucomicrobiae bacterium]|nr:glycosyltransferase [Verrucomicrobiae bacterium]